MAAGVPDWSRPGAAARPYLGGLGQPDLHPADHSYRRRGSRQPVLPFGDLATIGFFVAMAVAVHQGNLFRTLISGVIIMGITLWIATQTIGLHTQLAANAGALKAGGMVASMDGWFADYGC